MTAVRAVPCLVVAGTGIAVAGPNVARLAAGGEPPIGLLLAALGTLLGVVLVAGGGWLYRSDLTTGHAARVAGWNTLGVIVLAGIIGLADLYLAEPIPLFVGANIVGVSAFAHVLIGVNDVRRIRAEALAREREKLAVLNRVLRHNLRNASQVLVGAADVAAAATDDPTVREQADVVARLADEFAAMNEDAERIEAVFAADTTAPVDVAAVAQQVVAEHRDAHPDATIEVDVPDDLSVLGGPQLHAAVDALVENAIEHTDADEPWVRIAAERTGDGDVAVSVADDGPGIPREEWAVVAGDREITQLDHASGLGLWLARWFAEEAGGDLQYTQRAAGGSRVTLRLPAADTHRRLTHRLR